MRSQSSVARFPKRKATTGSLFFVSTAGVCGAAMIVAIVPAEGRNQERTPYQTYPPSRFALRWASPTYQTYLTHQACRYFVAEAAFTETPTCTFVQQHWNPPPPEPVESLPSTRRM